MIFNISRADVGNEQLWQLVCQVNQFTDGSYKSWTDNGTTLVQLMERIMKMSRNIGNWQVYFSTMMHLLYLVRRNEIMDTQKAFKIAKVYYREYHELIDQITIDTETTGHWIFNTCRLVLAMYLEFPQMTDDKISKMLELFTDNVQRFGTRYNQGNYEVVMDLALINQDKELAAMVKKKLDGTDYKFFCYICFYTMPVIIHHVLFDDYAGVDMLISNICSKELPAKYLKYFEMCENTEEQELTRWALKTCLKAGNARMFKQLFTDRGEKIFRMSQEYCCISTIVFQVLAGECSHIQDCLRLAQEDDQSRRQQRETPLESLYDALFWYCYFLMLEKWSNKTNDTTIHDLDWEEMPDGVCSCREASAYFEHQADLLGAQMAQARRRYQYALIKRTFEECLLNDWKAVGETNGRTAQL